MGTLDKNARDRIVENSDFYGLYEKEEEREDAAHLVLADIREKEEEEEKKKQEEKEKKAKEKERKSSESYKLMNKIKNMALTRVIGKGLTKGFKLIGNIFTKSKK